MSIDYIYGWKLNNYEKYAASGTDFWTDTTHYKAEVPSGKRWWFIGGVISRAVSSTVAVWHKDASDNVLFEIDSKGAATGVLTYPTGTVYMPLQYPYPMDAGEYVEMIFGTAQNTSSYASCIVIEVDM